MKNFGILFVYEMKKIWKRKLVWAILALIAAFMVYDLLPHFKGGGITYRVEMEDGSEVSRKISDQEQFEIERVGTKLLEGQTMDETFFQHMRTSLPKRPPIENLEAYTNFDYMDWFYLIDPTYLGFYRYMNPGLDMETITAEKYYGFYRELIENRWKEAGLTADETAYWETKWEQVAQPFCYRDISGWSALISEVQNIVIRSVPMLVGVCLCDIFPLERRRRTNALMFSSQNGRAMLYLEKILAGAVSAVTMVLLLFVVAAAASGLIYGGIKSNAVIQLAFESCWPISTGQFLFIILALLFAYALLCGSLTMLITLLTGNNVAGLAASLVLSLLNMILPYSDIPYLPCNLISPRILSHYHLTDIAGSQFNTVQLGFLLYGGLTVFLLALCWFGWRRSAAGRA